MSYKNIYFNSKIKPLYYGTVRTTCISVLILWSPRSPPCASQDGGWDAVQPKNPPVISTRCCGLGAQGGFMEFDLASKMNNRKFQHLGF